MTSLAPNVDTAVRTRWPQRGAAWAAALPAELDRICAGLGVTPRWTYPARYAFVAYATSPIGVALVIRSSADPDAEHQAAVLRRLSDVGLAPRVHAVESTPTAVWTISDAVQPGTALPDTTSGPRGLPEMIAGLRVLAEGHAGPPTVPGLLPWVRARLTEPALADLPPGNGPAPDSERRAALDTLDAMEPPPAAQLCHGDLSSGNVLIGRNQLWLIDPRGINGDPAYDVAVVALKACRDDPTHARPAAATLATAATIDPDRAAAWTSIASAARV